MDLLSCHIDLTPGIVVWIFLLAVIVYRVVTEREPAQQDRPPPGPTPDGIIQAHDRRGLRG
jgi:hypothetical protein